MTSYIPCVDPTGNFCDNKCNDPEYWSFVSGKDPQFPNRITGNHCLNLGYKNPHVVERGGKRKSKRSKKQTKKVKKSRGKSMKKRSK